MKFMLVLLLNSGYINVEMLLHPTLASCEAAAAVVQASRSDVRATKCYAVEE